MRAAIMKSLCTADRRPAVPEAALGAWQCDFFLPKEIDAFNAALYARFGHGPMFVTTALGTLDIDRLLAAHGNQLWRAAT